MPPVSVRILHPAADPTSGPLSGWVADARRALADHHRRGFLAAGADDVTVVTGAPDGRPFGARLDALVRGGRAAGLVILGSGAIPLATAADRRSFVAAAASDGRVALANNRYSADIVAISRTETLPPIPDLPADNALPRWLEEVAGYRVDDLRRRRRLAFDIDGPLDLVLLGAGWGAMADGVGATADGAGATADGAGATADGVGATADDAGIETAVVEGALATVRTVALDRRSELLVAGRTSAATLAWLEAHAAARVRAWVEERGLRAASRLAQTEDATGGRREAARTPRVPSSILGALLERDGPGSLGEFLARFADAAIVDTRVLLAHRLGADEAAWPGPEDRFASDLLLADRIADPWLRELTASAAAAAIPVLLGGHSLVGPGIRFVVEGRARRAHGAPWT